MLFLKFADGKTILPSVNEIAVTAGGADNRHSLHVRGTGMSHPVTGNCRVATVLMNGSSPLAAALNVQQPTLAAKVDKLFLERVRAATYGPDMTVVKFMLCPQGEQEEMLVAVNFEGHELRLVLDIHDAFVRACFVESEQGAALRVIVFSDPNESCALLIAIPRHEYACLTCVPPHRVTSLAAFMATSKLSLALGDPQQYPRVHETAVPASVRSCFLITDQNRAVFEWCASLPELVLH